MPSVDRPWRRLRAGDLVEVRSREEILATLDDRGMLENLPFMPEMLRFCGQQLRVGAVAHKTCDTIERTGMRRMSSAVHLEGARCDGSAHGGCEAGCMIYWKKAWLKPARRGAAQGEGSAARGASAGRDASPGRDAGAPGASRCDQPALERATQVASPEGGEIRYRCQITEVLRATKPWAWWNPHHYFLDVRTRNWSLRHVLSVLVLASLRRIIPSGVGYRALLWLYDRLAARCGMHPYREVENQWGPIPKGGATPGKPNDLQAGDWVRVRPRAEILPTLDKAGRNRGMHFDPEMVKYCGGHYQVRTVIRRIVDEGSGRMLEMKNPCVALEGVICKSEYSDRRLMCPRAIFPYWRALWLEKTSAPADESSAQAPSPSAPRS